MRYLFTSIVLGLLTVGCAHGFMRGSVAMKVNEQEAHVCLGDNEVKAGDRVNLFRNQCNKIVGKVGANDPCHKIKIGEGTVTRTLDEHYSVVKVDSGVSFEEGTVVEKQ